MATVVHVVRGHVADGLVDPLVVVVIHKASDSALQFPRAVVILEPGHVLHRAMIALDLARIVSRGLEHGMAPGKSAALDEIQSQIDGLEKSLPRRVRG